MGMEPQACSETLEWVRFIVGLWEGWIHCMATGASIVKTEAAFKRRKVLSDSAYLPSMCYITFSVVCYHMGQTLRTVNRKGRAREAFHFFFTMLKR